MIMKHQLPILVLVLSLAACDSRTVDPFEKDVKPYSVHGYIDLDRNPNYVRVRQLNKPYFEGQTDSLDATVHFENLQTGAVTELRDSIVIFNGFVTNNFIIPEPLTPDSRYKLTVRRSDGQEVESVARIPKITVALVDAPGTISCETLIDFRFQNVIRPEYIRLQVGVRYQGVFHWATVGRVNTLRHRDGLDEMSVRMRTRNLLVELFPPPALDNPSIDPMGLTPTVNCNRLDETRIYLRYVHFGPEWNAVRFTTDPLESTSIDNGLGFFGGLRQDTLSYRFSL
jgi:hypothetical protein